MVDAVYLISSLPTLTCGCVPPISEEEFMHDVAMQLSKNAINMVNCADIKTTNWESLVGKLSSFVDLMSDLQKDKAAIRTAKKQKQAPKVGTLPKTVVNENPLDREKSIMQMQWDELTSLEAGDPFSFNHVLIYKLKLQLIQRLHSFDSQKGAAIFASVVNPQKEKGA